MKIESSAVTMDSHHRYWSIASMEKESIDTTAEDAAAFQISPDAKNYVEALREKEKDAEQQAKIKQKEAEKRSAANFAMQSNQVVDANEPKLDGVPQYMYLK